MNLINKMLFVGFFFSKHCEKLEKIDYFTELFVARSARFSIWFARTKQPHPCHAPG